MTDQEKEIEYIINLAILMGNIILLILDSMQVYRCLVSSTLKCHLLICTSHVYITKNKRISDGLVLATGALAIVLFLVVNSDALLPMVQEITISSLLSYFMVYSCKFEEIEEVPKADKVVQVKNSFKKLLDNIPCGILFFKKDQGVVDMNSLWMRTQSKLLKDTKKRKYSKLVREINRWDEPIAISDVHRKKAYEVLKYFTWFKDKSLTLQDIVNDFSNNDKKLWNSTVPDSNLFNTSFVEELKKVNRSWEESESKNTIEKNQKIQELTLICNIFSPPKEFVAYICLWAYPTDDNTVMVVLSDVSERIDLQASKVSEKIKTIMFCSISHELRSPLNHISGVHSLLKAKLVTEEQEGLLRIAESSTEILKIKIDDILDFYELESASFQLQRIPFDVRHQWKELETVFLPLMNARRTKLLFYVNEQTPKLLTHDACRIHKVLVNLISNAVKYTRSGAVVVSVDWKEAGRGEGAECEIKYSVSDTGRGISKEKKQSLFKFLDPDTCKLQEDSKQEETTQLAGTGLGISQKIMEKLGTKIEYTSTLGIGSTFWFTLKINKSAIHYESDKVDVQDVLRKDLELQKSLPIMSSRRSNSLEKPIPNQKKGSLLISRKKFEGVHSDISKSIKTEINIKQSNFIV